MTYPDDDRYGRDNRQPPPDRHTGGNRRRGDYDEPFDGFDDPPRYRSYDPGDELDRPSPPRRRDDTWIDRPSRDPNDDYRPDERPGRNRGYDDPYADRRSPYGEERPPRYPTESPREPNRSGYGYTPADDEDDEDELQERPVAAVHIPIIRGGAKAVTWVITIYLAAITPAMLFTDVLATANFFNIITPGLKPGTDFTDIMWWLRWVLNIVISIGISGLAPLAWFGMKYFKLSKSTQLYMKGVVIFLALIDIVTGIGGYTGVTFGHEAAQYIWPVHQDVKPAWYIGFIWVLVSEALFEPSANLIRTLINNPEMRKHLMGTDKMPFIGGKGRFDEPDQFDEEPGSRRNPATGETW